MIDSRTLRWVVGILGVALVIGLGYSTVYRSGPHTFGARQWGSRFHRCDFTVPQAAARAVLDGTDIYDAQNPRGWKYIYPPLFAIVMVPFALMNVFWGSLLWYALSVAMVVSAVVMCARMAKATQPSRADELWLSVIPPLLVLLPLLSALARGQTTPLLFWLMTAGGFFHWKGRPIVGGACLAGAILLKVFPVLLLAYFAWRRRWMLLAAVVVTLILGVFVLPAAVFGWQRNIVYLQRWVRVVGKPSVESESERENNPLYGQLLSTQLPRNQSLQAVLTRLAPGAWVRPAVALVGLAMLGVTLWSARNELLFLSATIAWMLLVSPVSWQHYFMVLMLPMALLTAIVFSDAELAARRLAGVALIVYAILALGIATSRALNFYGPTCWATMYVWLTLVLLARWLQSTS